MRLQVKTTELGKYIWVIKVLALTKNNQFAQLRQREVEVLAYLYMLYNSYQNLSEVDRFRLVFSKEAKKEIGTKLGITTDNLYNILVNLRKLGILEGETIKMKIPNVSSIKIEFV